MKNQNLRFTLTIILFLFLFSCKKNPAGSEQPNNDPCTASVASVENITVFPSDNPWNIDISGAPLDPYNDQIISGIG